MKEEEIVKKINEIIDKIRPFLINDGGGIEFIEYKDGIVYVKLLGHCQGCPMIDSTLKEGIELSLMSEIPEIKSVENVIE